MLLLLVCWLAFGADAFRPTMVLGLEWVTDLTEQVRVRFHAAA
jgi:hypothetical protein